MPPLTSVAFYVHREVMPRREILPHPMQIRQVTAVSIAAAIVLVVATAALLLDPARGRSGALGTVFRSPDVDSDSCGGIKAARSADYDSGGRPVPIAAAEDPALPSADLDRAVPEVGHPINFYRDPDAFVSAFASCASDEGCRIYYHHVGKTGGTTVETRMFDLFPPKFEHGTSCCGHTAMDRFQERRDDYCDAKFTSYQVKGGHFRDIVSECMSDRSEGEAGGVDGGRIDGRPPERRSSIALVSFREPIQRTLSSIHQTCNKNKSRRREETRAACERCSYDIEEDRAVWDGLIKRTNLLYEGIALVSRMVIGGVQVLTIDTVDVDNFFTRLRSALSPRWEVSTSGVRNTESLSLCNFGMTSDIFRALTPSETIYRNLTLGI